MPSLSLVLKATLVTSDSCPCCAFSMSSPKLQPASFMTLSGSGLHPLAADLLLKATGVGGVRLTVDQGVCLRAGTGHFRDPHLPLE